MASHERDIAVSRHTSKIPRSAGLQTSRFYTESLQYTSLWEHDFHEEIQGETYTGRLFDTDSGAWLIIPPSPELRITHVDTPYILNGATEVLRERESPAKTKGRLEKDHEKQIQFFSANWGKLFDIFYDNPQPPEQEIAHFVEVELNDYIVHSKDDPNKDEFGQPVRRTAGKADFIGQGSDGQLIIVEFGKGANGKANQLIRQELSLDAVIQDANHGEPNPPINTFIGQYTISGAMNVIHLIEPKFPTQFTPEPVYETSRLIPQI